MLNKQMVSVVIPFYSKKEYLAEALASVINQSYQDYEILLINDGSDEDISEILQPYSDKLIYIKQENKGAAAARNVGIAQAKGRYIAFLDADDIWEKDKLEKQVKYMAEKGCKWSHTAYTTFSAENDYGEKRMAGFCGDIFPKCLATNPIATPCVMIDGDILRENPGLRFKESMKSGEDSILWIMLAMNYEIGYIDEFLTRVRMRGTNSSLLAWHQLRARAEGWISIKNEKTIDTERSVCLPIRFAYDLCTFEYKVLKLFFADDGRNSGGIEFASKILYIIPWSIFKLFKNQTRRG